MMLDTRCEIIKVDITRGFIRVDICDFYYTTEDHRVMFMACDTYKLSITNKSYFIH